jgi:hypothetical protein
MTVPTDLDTKPYRDEHDLDLLRRMMATVSLYTAGIDAIGLLDHEKPPRQLDHAPPNPRIPGSRQPFFPSFPATLVRRASEAAARRARSLQDGRDSNAHSALAQWFRARTENARGTRKTMIVALARKLLIALWRLVREGVVPVGIVLRPAQ